MYMFGSHRLPPDRGVGFETRGAHHMDQIALTIKIGVEDRDDVKPIPDMCSDLEVGETEFFVKFAAQPLFGRLARLEAAAGQGPR